MGYTTDFTGSFTVTPAVSNEFMDYINKFSGTRRMKRDPEVIKEMDPEWDKHTFNHTLGIDGGYYTPPDVIDESWLADNDRNARMRKAYGSSIKNHFGQEEDKSILEYNYPPYEQPGLWCQWIMTDKNTLEWDGGEKFYNYVEWLDYLIRHFFAPSGYTISGTVTWIGEIGDDFGKIDVNNNTISIHSF